MSSLVPGSSLTLLWQFQWEAPAQVSCVKIAPAQWETNDVIRWAKFFALTNNCERIPGNFANAPGWWVRDFTDKRRLTWRMTSYSLRDNSISYASGDDGGGRWDIKRHEPLIRGVPLKEEALVLAVKLTRDLGIDINWARRSDGQLLTSQRVQGTGFIQRGTTNYVEVVQQQGIYLYQKVGDGTLLGSEQGKVLVRFISDGKVSDIEARIVVERDRRSIDSLSKAEVNDAVREGKFWLAPNLNLGASVEVVGADIVYLVSGRWQNRLIKPLYRFQVRKPGGQDTSFIFTEATRK